MVEWKELSKIVSRNKGISITAGQMTELASPNGSVRVFAAGSTLADIDEEKLPKNCAHKLPSIIVKSRGYIDFEFYDKPFTHKNEMWSYSFDDKQLGKYIYYYLTTKTDFFRKKAKANSVKLPQLCVADTDKYLIPIISTSEQYKIVEILDSFTSAIENLKQQIAERRKQYEYYRDKLLDLERKEGVEIKSLGSISELVTKQTGFDYSSKIKPELLKREVNGAIPFLQTRNFNGRSFNYETEYYVPSHIVDLFPKIVLDRECLLLSIVGASIGNVGLFPGIRKCFLGGAICVLKFKKGVNVPFIYEVMSSWYGQRLIQSKIKGAGQATITVEDIRNFMIPIPSDEEQMRIISILNTFEEGIQNLEAQLKLREKQYEYYRNKLFTFE